MDEYLNTPSVAKVHELLMDVTCQESTVIELSGWLFIIRKDG
jgi:hypothetical protein